MEEQTDVQVDPSTTEEEVSQEVVEQQAEPTSQPQEAEQTPDIPTVPPVGEQQVVEVDEVDGMGVPYKNRYMEAQRKLEKTQKQQEEILRKLDTIGQGSKQQDYSIKELEIFASETDNEAHRLWAQQEIRRKEKEEMANIVKSELEKRDNAYRMEQAKQQSLQFVMQRYPDAFSKNAAGQNIGWNTASPLTQRIGQYMQNPEIAKNPRGLQVAAALAFADVTAGKTTMVQKQTQKLKTEVKSLQKKTLIESGGGTPPQGKTSRQIAMEKTVSGKPRDAVEAMKELWKATGRLEG